MTKNKVKVYKDSGSGTWYWLCGVPFCDNSGWDMGHQKTTRVALHHLRQHKRVGFGGR